MIKVNRKIDKILILGDNGFIGSHLVAFLQKENPRLKIIGASFPQIDLTKQKDAQKLIGFFTKETAVIMLSGIKPNIENDLQTFEKNIAMVINVCKLLSQKTVSHFMYMSSAAVYGEDIHNLKIDEETPIQARSHYGMAKYTSERLLWKASKENGSILTILRPPVIYGEGEEVFSYNPTGFLKKTIMGEEITMWGDGKEKREFIFIDDLIKLIHFFVSHPYAGVVNVTSGKSYSFGEIIDYIRTLGFKPKIKTRKRSKDKIDNAFNNTLLTRLAPGFKFTPLHTGLGRVLAYEKMSRV